MNGHKEDIESGGDPGPFDWFLLFLFCAMVCYAAVSCAVTQ